MPELSMPPKNSILEPDHTAVWAARGEGALLGGKGRGVQLQVGQVPVRACCRLVATLGPFLGSELQAASSSSETITLHLRGNFDTHDICVGLQRFSPGCQRGARVAISRSV